MTRQTPLPAVAAALVLLGTAVPPLPAQILGLPPIDSVRVTVTPSCRAAECDSPFTMLVAAHGAVWFRNDSLALSGPADSALVAAYLSGVALVIQSHLPERFDHDSLLCPTPGGIQPVVTVAFYADTAVRRYVDLHSCRPLDATSGAPDPRAEALRRLRIFEDEIESLRPRRGPGHAPTVRQAR